MKGRGSERKGRGGEGRKRKKRNGSSARAFSAAPRHRTVTRAGAKAATEHSLLCAGTIWRRVRHVQGAEIVHAGGMVMGRVLTGYSRVLKEYSRGTQRAGRAGPGGK